MDENPATRKYMLGDAQDEYLKTHTRYHQKMNVNALVRFVIKTIGDKPLTEIRRADAKSVRDAWLARGSKTATVARNIAVMSAIFNKAVLEFEITAKNPFAGLEIEGLGEDKKDITPFTNDELILLAKAIMSDPGDEKYCFRQSLAAALQFETGVRIGEAIYLRTEDLHLDEPIPYIYIHANKELGRKIKNPNSERKVPLVGISLVAAQKALALNTGTGWLFNHPPGALRDTGRSSHTANVIAWLHTILPQAKGSHSFRYAMETRLTLDGCEQGIIDAIEGHVSKTKSRIASGYFGGYPLDRLQAALLKIALPVPLSLSEEGLTRGQESGQINSAINSDLPAHDDSNC